LVRLVPIGETGSAWQSLKAQWKTEAEGAGEDFSTFAIGTFSALDPLAAQEPAKSGLHGLYDGSRAHAFCQVNRLLMPRYSAPVLRARFATVSPAYDVGLHGVGGYAQVLVSLFSGVVWLSRNKLAADHVRFHLRSPGDAQFFAALQINTDLSPFSSFTTRGAWVECSLKKT
jgi:hypothetical protein